MIFTPLLIHSLSHFLRRQQKQHNNGIPAANKAIAININIVTEWKCHAPLIILIQLIYRDFSSPTSISWRQQQQRRLAGSLIDFWALLSPTAHDTLSRRRFFRRTTPIDYCGKWLSMCKSEKNLFFTVRNSLMFEWASAAIRAALAVLEGEKISIFLLALYEKLRRW
jgi:hypothetical protein